MSQFAILTSCMVGPDFHHPATPNTSHYTHKPIPKTTVNTASMGNSGKSQHFLEGQDIPKEWWMLFHSQALNDLIQRGLQHSPTLDAAKANLVQAHETLNAQVGNLLFPAFDANLGAQRQRFTGSSLGDSGIPSSVFSLYNANVTVSYNIDIFGASRRQIESTMAMQENQRYELLAAYITLTANITTTAISMAAYQAQITAVHALIKAEQDQMDVMQRQLEYGGIAESNVLQQQSQLAQTQALLPPLETNLAASKHALSVLIGELPSESVLPNITLEDLNLPSTLPVSVPSLLIRRRPDVLASEALLHSASAQVGVATANLFPQLNITGNYGWSGTPPSTLFHPITSVWDIGAGLTQPLFHAGALQAQRRAAIAAYQSADAQYRQVVLQAFQNVADVLRSLEGDAKSLRANRKAELAARDTLRITAQQLKEGGVSYLQLLTADQQYQQAKINRIKSEAARYADTAALFQALGGGWWNSCEPMTGVKS